MSDNTENRKPAREWSEEMALARIRAVIKKETSKWRGRSLRPLVNLLRIWADQAEQEAEEREKVQ
jgi:hypothetical protein